MFFLNKCDIILYIEEIESENEAMKNNISTGNAG